MSQPGPRKLHRILLVLGVLAFGLIITDRLMEAFRADDAPAELADAATPIDEPDSPADLAAAESNTLEELAMPAAEALVTLENLFGSPVVLVSATEPSYVLTEDKRRFDVGGVIDDATILAGVTSHQLIFEQAGDLLVISLPDPVLQ